ncbi:toll/interleukin-1 receptor domain-containing protein [Segetibacter aerophilus]|uniref:TIR domain-containing protein n=1 Tax=Segetibacter aerophilus TaxID=670293 RepID=A0A512BAV3_9BACT|nr:toll/interleukin-1 receptor domain-containing protein [Segetibacter aerophilus]GEO09083.1 hypothetical protein SAE01_15790 [Segetibacter aerophilus]
MPDIFISYAREDFALAKVLADSFTSNGWSVWWDRQIKAGSNYRKVISQNLDAAKHVIVLWTKNSITSDFVIDEASAAMETGKLVPILIGSIRPPYGFRGCHCITWDERNEVGEEKMKELLPHLTPAINNLDLNYRSEIDENFPPDFASKNKYSVSDTVADDIYSRPKIWHCIFCGWRCEEEYNDYKCKECKSIRPFVGGSATMMPCEKCKHYSLACASYCEWCGEKFED